VVRFHHEAEILERLRESAGCVRLRDAQTVDGIHLTVREYLRGGSLSNRLRDHGVLAPQIATRLASEILGTLQAVHRMGVVHRNLMPSSILLSHRGQARICDFAMARDEADEAEGAITRSGTTFGTWSYLAPEQRRDAASVDARADLYSVGALIHMAISLDDPFDIYTQQGQARCREKLPAPLADVVIRACQARPGDRFSSAGEMKALLQDASCDLDPDPSGAVPLVRYDEPKEVLSVLAEDSMLVEPGPSEAPEPEPQHEDAPLSVAQPEPRPAPAPLQTPAPAATEPSSEPAAQGWSPMMIAIVGALIGGVVAGLMVWALG
jgi:serine/threonine-protein kinase